MQLARFKDFDRSVGALYKRGGPFQKAAETVQAAMGRAEMGQDPLAGLRRTKHGESRIRHCVKYDLTEFSRLVTIQHAGYCVFLYCGDHEDTERWLNSHRGFEPVVDANFTVTNTYVSSETDDDRIVGGQGGHADGPLFLLLTEVLFERLISGLPRRLVRKLEDIESSVTEAELWTIVAEIDDSQLRIAVRDVFSLLRQDRSREAIERTRLFLGDSLSLEQVPDDELPDVVDGDTIRKIDPTSKTYAEALKRFMASAKYKDWMLFMHPEQEAVVNEDFSGAAKLVGVSGSGKTCVVVQRAIRLARKYEGEKILILTINKALARLIEQLVQTCASEKEFRRITVQPFFALCRDLITNFDRRNERTHNDVTWKTNEHIDEVWQEFYRCELNNYDARVLQPVHDTLLARGWNAERYLREEIDWLRSALAPYERTQYLEMIRIGRSVPLLPQAREAVLEGVKGWEDKMKAVGLIDSLGIAQALTPFLGRLQRTYRCVLIDEAQDFGNLELQIVHRLVEADENDLFICGDAAQAVTTKYQSLKGIDIIIPRASSRKLQLNYRNSRDVLTAAYHVLLSNLTTEMMDREDFEILDPEYSSFSASTPLILEADSLQAEIAQALLYAREFTRDRLEAKACIAICGFSLYELAKFGDKIGMPVLDGRTDIDSGSVFLSDLEQTKGFEFDLMCVLNCAENAIPSSDAPESERYRDLARFYVAMTRAKTDLVISWSGARSPFLSGLDEDFLIDQWPSYTQIKTPPLTGAPQILRAHRLESSSNKKWVEMNGEEFLYSAEARGLSSELIAKMRELVDGVGLRAGRERRKWRNLGDATADYRKSPRARNTWGPEVGKQFFELMLSLQSRKGRRLSN
jgi:hypothetical protein